MCVRRFAADVLNACFDSLKFFFRFCSEKALIHQTGACCDEGGTIPALARECRQTAESLPPGESRNRARPKEWHRLADQQERATNLFKKRNRPPGNGSGDAQTPFVNSPALLSCPSPCSSFWASWRLII
jgi:hypothetical protein